MQLCTEPQPIDVFIIGGGINGCGIARDAAGRGLSVALAEQSDLASATSSASTKLFHGGLRYLEYFKFRLVREALIEREILLKATPHNSWPMRFVLPYHRDMRFEGNTPISRFLQFFMPWIRGQRPAWLIRFGLFIYDYIGGRRLLRSARTIDLKIDEAGRPLKSHFKKAFEYSDCWVEDSRLVVLNARSAEQMGAEIMTRMRVTAIRSKNNLWIINLINTETGETLMRRSHVLVNAAGPWVGEILRNTLCLNTDAHIRLVRGSHIVTRKLYDHDKCYFLQGADGRVIFAIPYETDFTLIGTTDMEHSDPAKKPICTPEEQDYLINLASQYFEKNLTKEDIIWTYSGVRPLYDDGTASATAATRDYVLQLDESLGAPVLNVYGGKITTYRKLAEHALNKIVPFFPKAKKQCWTAGVALPGGDFPVNGFETLVSDLKNKFNYLDEFWAKRLVRAYGTESITMLADSTSIVDLGQNFGATLYEQEVRWLMEHEYVLSAEDILWRRSKLGLRLTEQQITELEKWIQSQRHEEQLTA